MPHNKIAANLEDAIRQSGLQDGMTVSFHHHLREGDAVINMVMDTIARMGLKDIGLAPSSLNPVNDELIPLVEQGVITSITTSGARSRIGEYLSRGRFPFPVTIRSHGGRTRAIEEGTLRIDVAFIAAPTCDSMGNISGTEGRSACGGLGYAMSDVQNAQYVIAITDNLVQEGLSRFSIPGHLVDSIVSVDSIGDASRISSGATRITRNPVDLIIAEHAARLMRSSPLYREGFSMQFGTGGASLAIAHYLSAYMKRDGVASQFVLGGITAQAVDMLEAGLVRAVYDAQCFDQAAVSSIGRTPGHVEVSAAHYAGPQYAGALVNYLDMVVLSAMEVDLDFNVNVLTGSDGVVRGASGGHCDAAQGARMVIIVAPSVRSRLPSVVDKVQTVITPGRDVTCVVTDLGIAWNPAHSDLAPTRHLPGIDIMDIAELKARVERLSGKPDKVETTERIVGVVEYRDGTIIDVLRQVAT